ncbi:hypothetical protein BUW96_12525 [Achromobacter insolitus]|nr:hypothetical protein BUW96_12525 [Achromobacter insolitus]OWT59787.1 hypothetical protein CEY08_17120 [Achromobacter insolitus]
MVADATAGYAALSLLDERVGEESDSMTTLEFKTSFLIPAVGDTIRCVAHVVGNGQAVAFLSAQVYVVNQGISKVCALTTLTFKRLRQQR